MSREDGETHDHPLRPDGSHDIDRMRPCAGWLSTRLASMRAARRVIQADVIDVYRRIIAASGKGRGVRLTPRETLAVASDDAVRQAVQTEDDDLAFERHEGPYAETHADDIRAEEMRDAPNEPW